MVREQQLIGRTFRVLVQHEPLRLGEANHEYDVLEFEPCMVRDQHGRDLIAVVCEDVVVEQRRLA